MASGSQSFFQVAVGLIPGLIFGGALLERRGGQRRAVADLPKWLRPVVAMFLLVGVAAQVIAIGGAIEPGVPDWQQYVVVGVVVAGTIGIAVMTLWVLGLAPEPTSSRLGLFVGVGIMAAAVVAVAVVSGSIDRANARLALDEATERSIRVGSELNAAEDTRRAARSDLIDLTDRERVRDLAATRRSRLGRTLQSYLYALDGISVSDREITRRKSLDNAFRELNESTDTARDAIRNLRLGASLEELISLAIERMSFAQAAYLTARTNAVLSRNSRDDTCRRAN